MAVWSQFVVPFTVFLLNACDGSPALERNFDLCIPRKGTPRPQSQFPQSCVCEQSTYSQDRSTSFPAAE
jgi:hypothetical protein